MSAKKNGTTMILMCGLNATLVVRNTIYSVQIFSIKQKIIGKSILTISNSNILNVKSPMKGVRIVIVLDLGLLQH